MPCFAEVDVITDRESRRVDRQVEVDKAVQKAAQEASARKSLEARELVTYQQVLADPDNIDLNFRYAKTQVAKGDLVGASATLERILMLDPSLAPIRLFFAIVLFRLDNLEEAEREFLLLRNTPMPEEQQKQVAGYLHQIRQQRKRLHIVSNTSIGWGFETNRNAAPSSKKRLFADTLLDLSGTSSRRKDTNMLALQSVAAAYDLPGGHQIVGSANYFLGEQTRVDDLDLESFSADGGLKIHTPVLDVTPAGFTSYLYLSRESFLRSQGAKISSEMPIGRRFALTSETIWTREDYLGITENTSAPERSGGRINFDIGGRYILTPVMQVSSDIGYERKYVNEDDFEFNAYEGFSLSGNHLWLLGWGQFLLTGLTYDVNGYVAPDTAISARTRRDQELRFRTTYGLPVSLVLAWCLPDRWLENLTATFNFEQFRAYSNITSYTYKNSKLGTMLSKRIEF